MKLTGVLTLVPLLHISASVYSQQVTLKGQRVKIKDALRTVTKQTGYGFLYNTNMLNVESSISVDLENAPLSKAMDEILASKGLTYKIEENTIVLLPNVKNASIVNSMEAQDGVIIKGSVVSDDGEIPLVGATITVAGHNNKCLTDNKGYFQLKVPENTKLIRINYVGYETKEIKIDSKIKEIKVRLYTKNNDLNEVVVRTGLYKRPVENYTGSARTITAEELKRVASSNILGAISVLDPSFRMPEDINLGSDPNRLPDIELRGQNNFPDQSAISNSSASLRNVYGDKPNAPLFVLDGFQVTLQRIYDLDMNRVERITVLKDAAATSIYGSRASNGVIVIDTRQPKEGTVRVSYRGGVTATLADLGSYDLLNAKEKLAFEKEVGYYKDSRDWPYLQTVRDAEYNERLKAVVSGVDTYWLSQPLQNAFGSSQSFFLDGGDQVVRYGINLNTNNDVGVMKGSGRNKLSGGVALTYRNKNLLFSNDLSINRVKSKNSPYGRFSDYTKLNQYWSPYDENGDLVRFLGQPRRNSGGGPMYSNYDNPLYNAILPHKDFSEQLGFTNNFRFEWSVLEWLKLVGGLGITHNNNTSDLYLSSSHTSFESLPLTERGRYTKSSGTSDLIDANIGFDIRKTWAKNLLFFTGNLNINEGKEQTYSTSAIGFPNEKVAELIFASKYDPATLKPSGSQGISRLVSSRMNANYSYDNKYLLDASLSMDASSQFGKDRQLAPFWSFGLGWNLHRESFLKEVSFINFLKVRGSVGTTGDQNFPPYMALSTYNYYSDQFYINQLSAHMTGYGNSALGWQKSIKRSIGTDAILWNNRISLSADFYHNTTNDLILDINTPPSMGFSSYKENAGALKNLGWQGNVNVNLIQDAQKELFWRVGVSAYANTNTITKISNSLRKLNEAADAKDKDVEDPDRNKPKNYYQEGQSLTAIYAVRSLGIDPANGQEIYLDRNGNRTYVWNADDKVSIGDTRPKVSGTINTGIDYKGFGFNIYFSYRLGASLYNQTLVDRVENADITYNVDRRVANDRWKAPGDHTFFKGIIGSADGRPVVETTLATSRFVQKEFMIEASRVSFSYQFPQHIEWMKRARLSNTRLELYMADPFYISTIKRERGLDYPFARSFTFNISTSIF